MAKRGSRPGLAALACKPWLRPVSIFSHHSDFGGSGHKFLSLAPRGRCVGFSSLPTFSL